MKILKLLLLAGTIFYLIGGIVHYFGLTFFPWFDGVLYSPYHDSIIAMASFAIAGFFFVTLLDPAKNRDNIWVIIIAAFISGILTLLMAYQINFIDQYGSFLKSAQSWIEGALLIALAILLFIFRKIEK